MTARYSEEMQVVSSFVELSDSSDSFHILVSHVNMNCGADVDYCIHGTVV